MDFLLVSELRVTGVFCSITQLSKREGRIHLLAKP